MRKPIFFITGTAVVAVAMAQVNTSALLTSFGKAMHDAQSVQSNYTVQTLHAGGPEEYSVVLKKPNLARIETPNLIVIADGKLITRYDKSGKTYYRAPQSDSEVKSLFSGDELNLWSGFFDGNAYKPYKAKDLGNRMVKGGTLAVVEADYDAKARKVVTYYLNQEDNVARKANIELDKGQEKAVSIIVDTKTLALNGDVPKDAFVFDPPADSREMTLEEINSAKWYYDLEEAKKVAAASGKRIFVDFYATWCGPCKMLERDCFGTEQFKQFGKKFVFCRIDVDAQASVAQAYGITAMPTQDVLDKDGKVLNQTIGYADPTTFFNFLRASAG
ncbi:MAG: thioredoxin domain-containing protein [Fimbriimonas sp.]|nr:thioredoxin domain-containing protein [Fimbriimonas sp.]